MKRKYILWTAFFLIVIIGCWIGNEWIELRQLCFTESYKSSASKKTEETEKDSWEELQKAMPEMTDVVVDDFYIILQKLCMRDRPCMLCQKII